MARTPDLEKRADLARRAFAHIRESGGARTTMAGLARALEIKRSTLYWYYPDLASIFAEVLGQMLSAQDTWVLEVVDLDAHPIDFILAYIRAVHDFWDGREADLVFMFQFWAAGDTTSPNDTLDQLRANYQPRRAAARELLAGGVAAGLVRPCDPDVVIGILGALLDGLLIQRLMERPLDLTPHHAWIEAHLLGPLRLDPTPPENSP